MTNPTTTSGTSLPRIRDRLYTLHRDLVAGERRAAEQARGNVSAGDFLQALLHQPEHAWLRPLSALLTRVDEHLAHRDGDGPPADTADGLLAEITGLMSPPRPEQEFGARYLERMQQDPVVVVAHARLRGELRRAAPGGVA